MTAAVAGLPDLSAAPAKASLLGLDLGTKTIGLAVSDTGRRVATPLALVRRRKFSEDARVVAEVVARYGIAGLVYGLPLNMDGSEGPRAQSTRAFARTLARTVPLPYGFWDERLSTAAVTRALIEADVSRRRRAEQVDAMAAAYILQGALDRLARAEAEAGREDAT